MASMDALPQILYAVVEEHMQWSPQCEVLYLTVPFTNFRQKIYKPDIIIFTDKQHNDSLEGEAVKQIVTFLCFLQLNLKVIVFHLNNL